MIALITVLVILAILAFIAVGVFLMHRVNGQRDQRIAAFGYSRDLWSPRTTAYRSRVHATSPRRRHGGHI